MSETTAPAPPLVGTTLFDRLGGYNAIAATADDLTDRLHVNAALNANPAIGQFHDKHEKAGFKYMLTAWVVANTGGPPQVYAGRSMTDAHARLTITSREFDIVMTECRTTFHKFNVPELEMEELMSLLESYRTRIVHSVLLA